MPGSSAGTVCRANRFARRVIAGAFVVGICFRHTPSGGVARLENEQTRCHNIELPQAKGAYPTVIGVLPGSPGAGAAPCGGDCPQSPVWPRHGGRHRQPPRTVIALISETLGDRMRVCHVLAITIVGLIGVAMVLAVVLLCAPAATQVVAAVVDRQHG